MLVFAVLSPLQAQVQPGPADPHPDDDTFVMLREASRLNDLARVDAAAARLQQYPLASYVEYYRLKPRLASTPPDEIRSFLTRYQGSAIADRMRNDWLLELGRARLGQFRPAAAPVRAGRRHPGALLRPDVARGARRTRDRRGARRAGQSAILRRRLQWLAGGAGPGQASSTPTTCWCSCAWPNETSSTGPARRVATLLGASDAHAAQAVDFPALAMARGVGSTRAEHEIYLVAISRMARSSLKLAQVALRKNLPNLTTQEQAIGWAVLAHAASLKLDADAKTNSGACRLGAPLSAEQVQWKTRIIAAAPADWKAVRAAINDMLKPACAPRAPGPTGWRVRCRPIRLRQPTDALAMYQRIADQNSFYGQLALEEMGQKIAIPPPGPALTTEELVPVAANPGLRARSSSSACACARKARANGTGSCANSVNANCWPRPSSRAATTSSTAWCTPRSAPAPSSTTPSASPRPTSTSSARPPPSWVWTRPGCMA
ncbi:hypothetical protein LP419_17715 [Massilia sp. H-1]|nr:hypothetical protein LP419_17715 [Massilia sp. H-1]